MQRSRGKLEAMTTFPNLQFQETLSETPRIARISLIVRNASRLECLPGVWTSYKVSGSHLEWKYSLFITEREGSEVPGCRPGTIEAGFPSSAAL